MIDTAEGTLKVRATISAYSRYGILIDEGMIKVRLRYLLNTLKYIYGIEYKYES